MGARVRRVHDAGFHLTTAESGAMREAHLSLEPRAQDRPGTVAAQVAEALAELDARVVRCIAFGELSAAEATRKALREALEDPDLPVTWIAGADGLGVPSAGLQLHAVSGSEVRSLPRPGQPPLRVWNDGEATHCVLAPDSAGEAQLPIGRQAEWVFREAQDALAAAGMGMSDVARTWFFLADILGWYGEFNRVRNDCFARCELRAGRLPASTGVGGLNAAGGAVAAVAWAVRPISTGREVVRIVPSPEQCPAPSYGSAFSRAVEVNTGGLRRLLVSGTASIEPGGATAHVGDAVAQIARTMEVVEAILGSRGMSLADTARATAYFKHPGDLPLFKAWLAWRGLPDLPVVNAACAVCRDDLLFELELDAVQAGD
jgi:enamine deaminase RidA (YjgF/YER057c/UK114 family)